MFWGIGRLFPSTCPCAYLPAAEEETLETPVQFFGYWYFTVPNYVLAALMYSLIGRFLEGRGFRVGMIAQPRWDTAHGPVRYADRMRDRVPYLALLALSALACGELPGQVVGTYRITMKLEENSCGAGAA